VSDRLRSREYFPNQVRQYLIFHSHPVYIYIIKWPARLVFYNKANFSLVSSFPPTSLVYLHVLLPQHIYCLFLLSLYFISQSSLLLSFSRTSLCMDSASLSPHVSQADTIISYTNITESDLEVCIIYDDVSMIDIKAPHYFLHPI